MTLRLNGSSSGYTEIDAPAAAGSNTLTLPTGNGSANQFLRNSSTAGTLEFANGGKILQVVMGTTTSRTTTSSTTFVDTNLSVSITPASTSNKVLIIAHESLYADSSAGAAYFEIARGSTALSGQSNGFAAMTSTTTSFFPAAVTFLDSPSTTSATTYTLQVRASSAANVLAGDNNKGVIIAMEVES